MDCVPTSTNRLSWLVMVVQSSIGDNDVDDSDFSLGMRQHSNSGHPVSDFK